MKSRKIIHLSDHLNGEASVLQDIREFERLSNAALLKILALSGKSLREGKIKPAKDAFRDIRKNIQGSQ